MGGGRLLYSDVGGLFSVTPTLPTRGPGLGFLWEPCSSSSYQLLWTGRQPFATSPSGAHFTTRAFGPKLGGTCPHPFSPTPASLPIPACPHSCYHPLPAGRCAGGGVWVPRCGGLHWPRRAARRAALCCPLTLVSFWPTSLWSQLFAGLLPQKQRVGCRSQE